MSKILLVYDDFAELNATELSLKKVTFDVIGLTNEYAIKDQIVAFNPDIVVGLGKSQRVSSFSIGKKLKEMTRWTGKSILLFPKDYQIPADDLIQMRMDILLETPLSVIRLIQIICKLLTLDEKIILDRLARSFAKDKGNDLAFSSFDSETVKMIKSIQGELEKMDPGKVFEISEIQNPTTTNFTIDISDETTIESTETKPNKAKKSFFDKENEKVQSNHSNVDPFAALISELKGESPVALPETTNTLEGDVHLELLGPQIKNEIQQKATTLSEKIKKYSHISAELNLYPESTIKKVKAKKVLKALKREWSSANLEAQDQARRLFVEQLFKVKKR